MKILMFLLRYLCLLALILVVVYAPEALQFDSAGATQPLPCYESVGRVWSQWLQGTWYQDAWFLITAGILLVLGFVRGVTAIWNVLYAISLTLMLAAASLFFLDLPMALPSAIGSMPELQFLPTLYRTDAALVSFIPVIFLLGLILSNARLRIFIYTIICYVLWYGLSELVTYLLYLWQRAETPFLPELLAFLFDTRWLLVTLIGAFLLIYDLILALGETFTKPAKPDEAKPSANGTSSEKATSEKAPAQPATSSPAAPATSKTPSLPIGKAPAKPAKPALPKPPTAPKPVGAPKPVLKTATTATSAAVATAATAAAAATAASTSVTKQQIAPENTVSENTVPAVTASSELPTEPTLPIEQAAGTPASTEAPTHETPDSPEPATADAPAPSETNAPAPAEASPAPQEQAAPSADVATPADTETTPSEHQQPDTAAPEETPTDAPDAPPATV